MKLYERDYLVLTAEEQAEWQSFESRPGESITLKNTQSIFSASKAVRHYRHLFPNHYLDPNDLESPYVETAASEFQSLLDSPSVTERDVLRFFSERRHYFIVGSIMKSGPYRFGHHAAFLFPEFPLGTNFAADFLIVGKGSDGYEFIFVELECPSKNSTLKEGGLGESFRKGIEQVTRWKIWIQENFASVRPTLQKVRNPRQEFPPEFYVLDVSRLHFVVVAGRRQHFKPYTYREMREKHQTGNTYILHYDHILDSARAMTRRCGY